MKNFWLKFTPRLIPRANGGYVKVPWWRRKFSLYIVLSDIYQTEEDVFYNLYLKLGRSKYLIRVERSKYYHLLIKDKEKLERTLKW